MIHHKSSENMSEIADNSIHLIVTSPPYNVDKDYEKGQSFDDYRNMLGRAWSECFRVLVDGGRIAVNVANVGRSPYRPLNAMITYQLMELGFLMRGEIIWDKGASVGSSTAWGSWCSASSPTLRDVHEYIMVFSKNDYKRDDGGESTISRDDFMECTKSIWRMQTESAKHVGHPAPFPVELPRRLIELYSFKHDIILDPFMGSGSTAIAAEMCGRQWVGYDTSSEYIELADKRIKSVRPLEMRELFE